MIMSVVTCMMECTPQDSSNLHFVPILENGDVYAYISAMTYGLAGGHDRIIVTRDTNKIDSNYIFYCDHLFYRIIENHLEIVLSEAGSVRDVMFKMEGIDVKLLNQLEYMEFLSNYKNDGYTKVETNYYNK